MSPVTTAEMPVQPGPLQILIGPPVSWRDRVLKDELSVWQPGPASPTEPLVTFLEASYAQPPTASSRQPQKISSISPVGARLLNVIGEPPG